MPRSGVQRIWNEHHDHSQPLPDAPRRAAITLAARYRTSWTAACNQLADFNLISRAQADRLKAAEPTRGD